MAVCFGFVAVRWVCSCIAGHCILPQHATTTFQDVFEKGPSQSRPTAAKLTLLWLHVMLAAYTIRSRFSVFLYHDNSRRGESYDNSFANGERDKGHSSNEREDKTADLTNTCIHDTASATILYYYFTTETGC